MKYKKKPNNFCCERFKTSYEEDEITYAYEYSPNIDETDWFINAFWHLYFCPFCGAYIKGRGFGEYNKKYPPNKLTRIIKQKRVTKNSYKK